MKILYISSLIFTKASSASIRNAGLIKGLIEKENEVDILTIEINKEFEDKYLIDYLPENLKIIRTKLTNFQKCNNFIKKRKKNKVLNYMKEKVKDFYFFPDVYKEWIKKVEEIDIENYDLIISSSDTKSSHYVAKKLIKGRIKPWIQIWGDPWLNDVNLKNKSIFLKKIIEKEEKKLLKEATKIIYVSKLTAEQQREKFKLEKIYHINRGFLESIDSKLERGGEEYKFIYTGVLNLDRDITSLVKKIEQFNLKHKKKIKLYIYGFVEEKQEGLLRKYDFIELKGTVSYEEIKKIYEWGDVLIFIDNGKKTTQIPGKIYDYLGTNKKIMPLFQEKNEIYKYFSEYLKISPIFINDIKLEEFLNSSERIIDKRFDNKVIAEELLNIIKEN